MAKLSSVPLAYIEPGSISLGVESWTLDTLRERYEFQPITPELAHKAMADRELLFDLMEYRNVTDPKILEMTDFLMHVRNECVRLFLGNV